MLALLGADLPGQTISPGRDIGKKNEHRSPRGLHILPLIICSIKKIRWLVLHYRSSQFIVLRTHIHGVLEQCHLVCGREVSAEECPV